MLFGQNLFQCIPIGVVAAVNPLHRRGVEVEDGVGSRRVDDVEDTFGRPRRYVRLGGDHADRTDERDTAGGEDQVGAMHRDRDGYSGETDIVAPLRTPAGELSQRP